MPIYGRSQASLKCKFRYLQNPCGSKEQYFAKQIFLERYFGSKTINLSTINQCLHQSSCLCFAINNIGLGNCTCIYSKQRQLFNTKYLFSLICSSCFVVEASFMLQR